MKGIKMITIDSKLFSSLPTLEVGLLILNEFLVFNSIYNKLYQCASNVCSESVSSGWTYL